MQAGTTIDKEAQNVTVKEEQKCRQLLVRILDFIRFLVKQNLALRGHREIVDDSATGNKGNFLALKTRNIRISGQNNTRNQDQVSATA